jgi:hypothetical protein
VIALTIITIGKSTNLAKITFWLNENGHRVLIAAADTFRAGAVEQLRTHCRHLNSLHEEYVHLFEQGLALRTYFNIIIFIIYAYGIMDYEFIEGFFFWN